MAVPGRPKIVRDPLEILENDGTIEPPLLSQYYIPLACGFLGFAGVVIGNWTVRRPVMSGIQRHILFTALGTLIGKKVDEVRNRYYADRDAVFRDYIRLHPDDFPPLEAKLIRDVFEPWDPIR